MLLVSARVANSISIQLISYSLLLISFFPFSFFHLPFFRFTVFLCFLFFLFPYSFLQVRKLIFDQNEETKKEIIKNSVTSSPSSSSSFLLTLTVITGQNIESRDNREDKTVGKKTTGLGGKIPVSSAKIRSADRSIGGRSSSAGDRRDGGDGGDGGDRGSGREGGEGGFVSEEGTVVISSSPSSSSSSSSSSSLPSLTANPSPVDASSSSLPPSDPNPNPNPRAYTLTEEVQRVLIEDFFPPISSSTVPGNPGRLIITLTGDSGELNNYD